MSDKPIDTPSEPLSSSLLIELLRRQQALYRRLRLLADRQKAAVAQNDAQPLLALLSERQSLVDTLVHVNEQLVPYRKDWSGLYGNLEDPVRAEVAELLEEANAALGSILQCDRRDTATLAAKTRDFADRLTTVGTGTRANAAYAAAGADARRTMTDAKA
jgi:hypothetical protein